MLNGNIQIRKNFFVAHHGIDKLIGDALGIRIQQTDPLDAFHAVQFVQQTPDLHLSAIRAKCRYILRHHDQFPNTFGCEEARLRRQVFHGAAAQPSTDHGNGTVIAAVGAPLGNL